MRRSPRIAARTCCRSVHCQLGDFSRPSLHGFAAWERFLDCRTCSCSRPASQRTVPQGPTDSPFLPAPRVPAKRDPHPNAHPRLATL